ncbi:MAG: hypothetical protein M4579_006532 [Chaenotheca gracillima]|nr:MAG: hypothetical protein M4579_006532 [Chaenotheca gracillima]
MVHLYLLVGLLAATTTLAQTDVGCLENQTRAGGAPYISTVITDALLKDITSKTGICYGGFSKLPNGHKAKSTRRSDGSLVMKATRHAEKVVLGKNCVDSLSLIVNTCIGGGISWGGNVTFDSVSYTIFNDAYPKNWIPKDQRTPSPSKRPTSIVKGPTAPLKGPTTPVKKPPPTTSPAKWKTSTLAGVTGPPGSVSQTKTTDKNGLATVLPIWFLAGGAAVLVVPAIGVALGAPPPPPGLPVVNIGPDGLATAESDHQDHSPTHRSMHSSSHSASRTPSSGSSSTSSSASSTASSVPYMVIPKDPHDDAQNNAITSLLRHAFGSTLMIVQNPETGLVLWTAPMTQYQAVEYARNPGVESVTVDRELKIEVEPGETDSNPPPTSKSRRRSPDQFMGGFPLESRDEMLVAQANAPWELVDISHRPGQRQVQDQYVYNEIGGRGSTVYVLDSGANVHHRDYIKNGGSHDWLFPAGRPGTHYDQNKDDLDEDGHGTCVLSKAAGGLYGVAKNANTVVVRWPRTEQGLEAISSTVLVNALNVIVDDVVRKRSIKNVLVLSFLLNTSALPAALQHLYLILFQSLINLGVILFVSSGNNAHLNPQIDTFPATLALVLPIINVGAIDYRGRTSDLSQGGQLLGISAPGVNIACASSMGWGVRFRSGTSFAAPMAAGLAAYLLSIPKYDHRLVNGGSLANLPRRMAILMRELGYVRPGGTERSIFNGVKWFDDTDDDSSAADGYDSCEGDSDSDEVPDLANGGDAPPAGGAGAGSGPQDHTSTSGANTPHHAPPSSSPSGASSTDLPVSGPVKRHTKRAVKECPISKPKSTPTKPSIPAPPKTTPKPQPVKPVPPPPPPPPPEPTHDDSLTQCPAIRAATGAKQTVSRS